MSDELVVHMRHVRAAKICSRGSREFFTKHGLDWSDFLDNGIPASTLERIGDPIALRAADAARAESLNDGR